MQSWKKRKKRLKERGLVGASDHGVNKSLYAVDPDGIEFEVMWLTPEKFWGDSETSAVIEPLDLEGEIEKFGRDLKGELDVFFGGVLFIKTNRKNDYS